jgi:hypothetical protein
LCGRFNASRQEKMLPTTLLLPAANNQRLAAIPRLKIPRGLRRKKSPAVKRSGPPGD